MARIVSDHSRRWFPATGRFQPDPPSDVALVLFCREARRRLGVPAGEATIAYHHCRGVVGIKEVAALRGCAVSTVKNTKDRLYQRLGLYGNYQTAPLVIRLWPLYQEARRAAALVQTITEVGDAPGLGEEGFADAGAGAAVHRGGAGALPGVRPPADSGADRRD